jgi:hypothetical protein
VVGTAVQANSSNLHPRRSPGVYLRDDFDTTRINAREWRHWWGEVDVHGKQLSLTSQPPTTFEETHSALITSRSSWTDYAFSYETHTVEPLRQGDPPKPWEVGWTMFRFQDLENYYWFMLKPNGYELGKKHGSDGQIFLVTGDSPQLLIGRTHRVRIAVVGGHIVVWVDGTKLIDYTDGTPLLRGGVGLYEEDAHVHFDRVRVLRAFG